MKEMFLSAQVSWGGSLLRSSKKLGLGLSLVGSAPILSLHLRVIRPSWGGSYTSRNTNIFIFSGIFGCQMDYSCWKAMAPHSSTLAWKTPWMEGPGRLQSMGSLRVGHNWASSLSLFTFMHWRREWQPTPVFLPGESQGWGSLVGCRLWGHTE